MGLLDSHALRTRTARDKEDASESMAKSGEKMEIDTVFKRMNVMHWVLLFVSMVAAASGIMFAHGPRIF